MRAAISLLLSTLIASSLFGKSEEKVSPYGRYFEDRSGLVSIEMATFDAKNKNGLRDVILIMRGLAAYQEGIDGKAIRYKAVRSGRGFDLRTKKNGKDYTRMISRKSWGSWDSLTVYLDGQNIPVYENARKSKEVRPLHLRTALSEKPRKYKTYDVNPYGVAFKSAQGGLEIEMAVYNKKNKHGLRDVLLKITGQAAHEAGIDGKVIRYNAVPGGSGVDYQYQNKGKTLNRMIKRKRWGWNDMEVFLVNQTFKVYPDVASSSEVRPIHLLTAFQKAKKGS